MSRCTSSSLSPGWARYVSRELPLREGLAELPGDHLADRQPGLVRHARGTRLAEHDDVERRDRRAGRGIGREPGDREPHRGQPGRRDPLGDGHARTPARRRRPAPRAGHPRSAAPGGDRRGRQEGERRRRSPARGRCRRIVPHRRSRRSRWNCADGGKRALDQWRPTATAGTTALPSRAIAASRAIRRRAQDDGDAEAWILSLIPARGAKRGRSAGI